MPWRRVASTWSTPLMPGTATNTSAACTYTPVVRSIQFRLVTGEGDQHALRGLVGQAPHDVLAIQGVPRQRACRGGTVATESPQPALASSDSSGLAIRWGAMLIDPGRMEPRLISPKTIGSTCRRVTSDSNNSRA